VNLIIVDGSNLHLTGRRVAEATGDGDWMPHYGELRRVCDPELEAHGVIVGSHPAGRTPGWLRAAHGAGWVAASLPRVPTGRGTTTEKAVDALAITYGVTLMNRLAEPGTVTLVGGDGDFVPLLTAARSCGWRSRSVFFAGQASAALLAQADEVVDLTPQLERLRHRSGRLVPSVVTHPRLLGELAGPDAFVLGAG
jgi:hypothetical protein